MKRFNEIINHLTGLTTPIFGVSQTPPELQITIARRVLSFLEDRCVLYNPCELEFPEHCVRSVLGIRRYLTIEVQSSSEYSGITPSLRALRAACRKFLDTVGAEDDIALYGAQGGHYASQIFGSALGELRGVFGVHIAKLAASQGLDFESDLASILPGADRDDFTI